MQLREEKIQQIIDLIGKRLRGELTVDEEAFLVDWAAQSDENRQLFDELNDAIYRSQELRRMAEYTDAETALANFLSNHVPVLKVHKNHFVKRFVVVAAAVAAIVFGVWFMTSESGALKQVQGEVVVNDIAPGKNTATLTFADGKVINLDSSRTSVVVADSVKVMTMLTAATPRGGTYQVVLPDGTHVWLNADSKIYFPSQLIGKERKILLEGEAYFEVFVDKVHPFIVQTDRQTVEVLGTHFNINSYADEIATKTTLVEGSVKVKSFDLALGSTSKILKPNQQLISNEDGSQLLNVNTEEFISWKDDYFRFNGERIESIMKKLARWYNIEVAYEGKVTTETFTGTMSRKKNISQVLMVLEKTKGVHFKIEGRRVIVSN